ncbi:MAG: hypothetical protein HUK24_00555 [Sphaerochaetaceae bacterium]|nr:hypothetical protein [Sphaerochaetaceae bacterium]
MSLSIIETKLKKAQFTKNGCGNLTEFEPGKELTKEMLDIAVSGEKLVTMKLLTYKIEKAGKKFAKNADSKYYSELYNQFVGDWFEAFAEYFFKTCSNNGQYGITCYEAVNNQKDWGVDGFGYCADERESSGGKTPCVVQVKFRSNQMDEISYTCLAKTFADGVKHYELDPKRKNNVILFCNTENGANYLAKEALGDNLYVIDKRSLDKDMTGIKTVSFWEGFLEHWV